MRLAPPWGTLTFDEWYRSDLAPDASPEFLRWTLNMLFRMHDAAVAMRADLVAENAPLSERVTAAEIQRQVDTVISRVNARLRSLARRGGRGVPPLAGAGCSPADMGHGCPALSPAVGPAALPVHTADITSPADPLFCASEVQELPVGETLPHTRSGLEVNP